MGKRAKDTYFNNEVGGFSGAGGWEKKNSKLG